MSEKTENYLFETVHKITKKKNSRLQKILALVSEVLNLPCVHCVG